MYIVHVGPFGSVGCVARAKYGPSFIAQSSTNQLALSPSSPALVTRLDLSYMGVQSVLSNSPPVGKTIRENGLLEKVHIFNHFYKSIGCSLLLEL